MSIYHQNINRFPIRFCFVVFGLVAIHHMSLAQADTLKHPARDTVLVWDSSGKPVSVFDSSTFAAPAKKLHDPKKATMRSLIFPGWGQAYNKQYWKIPIVWGALAIPITTYFKNNSWYSEAAKVYNIVYNTTQQGSMDPSLVAAKLAGFSDYQDYWNKLYAYNSATASTNFLQAVQSNRNYYRRNRDYSVLWLLILWGVNVADATVFGHLSNFDVSPNLGMQVSPTYLKDIKVVGLNVVFNLK